MVLFAFYGQLSHNDSHIPPRNIKPVSYHLNDGIYNFSIRNIRAPINHENKKDEFIKPYIVIENTQKIHKNYVLILMGGPWDTIR